MLLRFSKDGTTITLSGDGAAINSCTYIPRAPDLSEQEIIALMQRGDWETLARLRVTESATVILEGTSSAILTQYRAIEAMFPWRRARNDTERLYVEYRVESSGDIYRAEVFAGRVEPAERSINRSIESGVLEIVVAWDREPWWNGPEAQVRLWNSAAGFVSTGGIAIKNRYDATGVNNADPGPVAGVLPAACRLVLRNAAGAAVDYNHIYIGHNTYPSAATFQHIVQGEDNTAGGGSVQPGVADTANYSGGYYYQRTWASALASTTLYEFTISGSQLVIADGRHYRILARTVGTPNATCYVRAGLYHQGLFKVVEGPEMKLDGRYLHDFGVLQLPPALTGLAALGALTLRITARDTAAGSLSIDFLQLTPLDSWRHIYALGSNYPDGTEFVDDGIADLLYVNESGTANYPEAVAEGPRVLLWPGIDQRLVFLFDEGTAMNIGRASEVEVHYRPRRRTL